jgi:arginine-tRNA-protein transferase
MKDHIVRDETESCPYLPGRIARMPLMVPATHPDGYETDSRLASGQRRAGEFVYKTNCPDCQACIPLRLMTSAFRPSRSQTRVLKRGDREIEMMIGPLQADQRRIELFNKHRRLRNLGKDGDGINIEDYRWGFVRSCFESFEFSFCLGGRLVAVAICDLGMQSLSAVYTFYDPEVSGHSLGTYSIMKQIEFCRQQELEFLYLGFYIEDCRPMSYKSRFRPNQRLINGQWQDFA